MTKITKWKHGLKSNSSPLAHQDYATLDNFIYDDSGKGRLDGSKPISTTLNTFYIGDQHGMSSGGENIFFQNQTTGINWYPPWMGLKDHRDPANRGEEGLVYLTYREYSESLLEAEFNGPITTDIVDYVSETETLAPISVLGIDMVIGEDLTTDDKLFYRAYIADETMMLDNARAVYEQEMICDSCPAGTEIEWWFDHPIDAFPGYTFYIIIYKQTLNDPEVILKAYGSNSTNPNLGGNKPWINLKYRTFEDVNLSSDPTAIFITQVKANPVGSGTVNKFSADGFNIDSIETTTGELRVTVEWDRGRNHFDEATINGVPADIKFTSGGTHVADAAISIDPNVDDIIFRVGRAAKKICTVTAI